MRIIKIKTLNNEIVDIEYSEEIFQPKSLEEIEKSIPITTDLDPSDVMLGDHYIEGVLIKDSLLRVFNKENEINNKLTELESRILELESRLGD